MKYYYIFFKSFTTDFSCRLLIAYQADTSSIAVIILINNELPEFISITKLNLQQLVGEGSTQ